MPVNRGGKKRKRTEAATSTTAPRQNLQPLLPAVIPLIYLYIYYRNFTSSRKSYAKKRKSKIITFCFTEVSIYSTGILRGVTGRETYLHTYPYIDRDTQLRYRFGWV